LIGGYERACTIHLNGRVYDPKSAFIWALIPEQIMITIAYSAKNTIGTNYHGQSLRS
tara:strand:- start:158 stop:328 length:171 start_codon:yes stop_codon:yes gene_type:complete